MTPRQPERGRELATLARHCLANLDGYDGCLLGELEALVWAHLGNSYRAPRDLQRTARCFSKVRRLLKSSFAEMPGLRGTALMLLGSFLRDQRKLSEAREVLGQALDLDREGKHYLDTRVRAILNLASLDFEEGDAEAAVTRMRELLAKLDEQKHRRYAAEARFNLAYFLAKRAAVELFRRASLQERLTLTLTRKLLGAMHTGRV